MTFAAARRMLTLSREMLRTKYTTRFLFLATLGVALLFWLDASAESQRRSFEDSITGNPNLLLTNSNGEQASHARIVQITSECTVLDRLMLRRRLDVRYGYTVRPHPSTFVGKYAKSAFTFQLFNVQRKDSIGYPSFVNGGFVVQ